MSHRLLGRFSFHALLLAVFIAGTAWAADTVFHFDIPSQSLASALRSFGQTAGEQIIFTDDVVTGMQSAALRGDFSAAAALEKLLAGTGLRAERSATGVLMIRKPTQRAGTARIESARPGASPPSQGGSVAQVDQANAGPQVGEQQEATNKKEPVEEIVVTGTHIRGGQPVSPLIEIDSGQIEQSGYQTAGDVIRSLPQSFGGGVNPNVVGGNNSSNPYNPSGASTANLRGLGSDSTLTLLNGHRLAFSDVSGAVDISAIPLPAVDRIEVLTDGASAIYGSDAVGGVVNFIMKRHYDGLETQAAYGASKDGGGTIHRYDGLAGHSWASGDALISYEYASQDQIFANERSYSATAGAQTTLIPKTERNSVFAALNQSLSSTIAVFAQALYTARSSDSSYDQPGALVITDDASVHQYGITVGAHWQISQEWQMSLTDDFAQTLIHDPQRTFTSVALTQTNEQGFTNRLSQFELGASGPLLKTWAGSVNLAAGASYRRETLSSPLTIEIPNTPSFYSNIAATRHVTSTYLETNIPLVAPSDTRDGLESLELSLAGRYEDYNDFGSSSIPKVGVICKPIHDLQLKGSWGKSFRAPTLTQEFDPQQVYLFSFPYIASPTGFAPALYRLGGNPDLSPQRSTSSTLTVAYSPSAFPGGTIETTYFHIRYTDRIVNPVPSASPLTDPSLSSSPFILRNPTPAEQAAIIASVGSLQNFSGGPYDPATVVAAIDNRFSNAAIQRADGVDLLGKYRLVGSIGDFDFTFDATYLDLEQKLTELTANEQLSGTVFNPSRVRGRAGASWSRTGWSTSLFVNYVGKSSDPSESPAQSIGSWTTVDARVAYEFNVENWAKGTGISLAVENAFDKPPPYVATGQLTVPLHFDPTNASAIGRFITVQLSKQW